MNKSFSFRPRTPINWTSESMQTFWMASLWIMVSIDKSCHQLPYSHIGVAKSLYFENLHLNKSVQTQGAAIVDSSRIHWDGLAPWLQVACTVFVQASRCNGMLTVGTSKVGIQFTVYTFNYNMRGLKRNIRMFGALITFAVDTIYVHSNEKHNRSQWLNGFSLQMDNRHLPS